MKKIEEFALEKASKLDYNHNEDHVLRTVKLAEIIGKKEGADLEVCRVAAYLHDIGQEVQFKDHEPISEKMARKFLTSLKLPKAFVEDVCHAIICHKNDEIKNAKTIEAKVLFDADKLQVVGIFGFCRIYSELVAFRKETLKKAMKMSEFIQNDRIPMLKTKTGKELAKDIHKFMTDFYGLYKKWDKVEL